MTQVAEEKGRDSPNKPHTSREVYLKSVQQSCQLSVLLMAFDVGRIWCKKLCICSERLEYSFLPIPSLVHSLVKKQLQTWGKLLDWKCFQHLAAIAVLHPPTVKLASGRATDFSSPANGLHYQTHQKCLKKRKRQRQLKGIMQMWWCREDGGDW